MATERLARAMDRRSALWLATLTASAAWVGLAPAAEAASNPACDGAIPMISVASGTGDYRFRFESWDQNDWRCIDFDCRSADIPLDARVGISFRWNNNHEMRYFVRGPGGDNGLPDGQAYWTVSGSNGGTGGWEYASSFGQRGCYDYPNYVGPSVCEECWRVGFADPPPWGGPDATVTWSIVLPEKPAQVSLASPSHGASAASPVTLSWNPASRAIGYELQVASSSSFSGASSLSVSGTSTPYTAEPGTWYWRVRGTNSGGAGAWSASRSFSVAHPPCAGPSLASPSEGETVSDPPTFRWESRACATSYRVEISSSPGMSGPTTSPSLTGTSWTPSPLGPGTHYWRVQSIGQGGPGTTSAVRSLRVPAPPCAAPSATAPTDRSEWTSVPTLQWQAVSCAIGYDVEISSSSSFGTILQRRTGTTATSWHPDPLGDGTYYWRLRSVGEGAAWGPTLSFTIQGIRCDSPTLREPGHGARVANSVSLTWDAIWCANRYEAELAGSASFSPVLRQSTLEGARWELDGLAAGTYHWRVRSLNSAGAGPWSASRSFVVDPSPCGPPSRTAPAADSTWTSPPTLSWRALPCAGSYEVQVSTTSSFTSPVIGSPTGTSWTPSSLADGRYHWRVRAAAPGASMPWSTIGTFEMQRAPPPMCDGAPHPTSPEHEARSRGVPTLVWTSVHCATGYEVEVSTSPEFSSVLRRGTPTSTSWTPSGLTVGTYHWHVRPTSSGGPGSFGPYRTFTIEAGCATPPSHVSPGDGASVTSTDLTWTAVDCATSYDVEVARNRDGPSALWATVTSTSWTPALDPGTYHWRVRMRASSELSDWSAYRSFHYTRPPTSCAAPSHLEPAGGSGWTSPPTLRWTGMSCATVGYEVELSTSSSFSTIATSASVGASQYTPSGLADGRYHWRVRSLTSAGPGPWSTPTSFTLGAPPACEAPAPIAPAPGALVGSSPRLEWTAVGCATAYDVAWSAEGAPADRSPTRAGGTSHTPVGLAPGTYRWIVRAVKTDGTTSAWSAERTFVVDAGCRTPPTPLGPEQGASSADPPRLSWSTRSGCSSTFRVEIARDLAFTDLARSMTTAGPSWQPDSLPPGTYQWRVRAFEPPEESAWSEVRRFTILPPPCTGAAQATMPESDASFREAPRLGWTRLACATQYEIEIRDSAGSLLPRGLTTDTAWTPTLGSGSYQWRVRALNPAGDSGWSTERGFRVLAAPCETGPTLSGPISGLRHRSPPALAWNALACAHAYEVEIAADAAFSASRSTLQAAGTTVTPGPLADGTHHWRVRAVTDGVAGPWSAAWSFHLGDERCGAAPPLLTPAPQAEIQGRPSFSWSTFGCQGSYSIEIAHAVGGRVALARTGLQPPFEPDGLAPGDYTWRVRLVRGTDAAGPWSAASSFRLLPPPCAGAPQGVVPAVGQRVNAPVLSWSRLACASGYEWQVGTSADLLTPVASGTAKADDVTATAVGLAPGSHHWRVRATNAGGPGPWSAPAAFVLLPPAPGAPNPTAPAEGSVLQAAPTLAWSATAGAERYEVQVSTTPAFRAIGATATVASTTWTPPPLPEGEWRWRVRALNEGGEGDWSETWSFRVAKLDLGAWKIELTQGIQRLGSAQHADNSVPLLAGRALVVRAYVAVGGADAPVPASARLEVRPCGAAWPAADVYDARATLDPSLTLEAARALVDRSFDFKIPAERVREGCVDLRVTIDPGQQLHEVDLSNNAIVEPDVRIGPERVLRLRFVRISFPDEGGGRLSPGWTEVPDLVRYLESIFPVSRVEHSRSPIEIQADAAFDDPREARGWANLGLKVLGVKLLDPAPDGAIYYGLVDSDVPACRRAVCIGGMGIAGVALGLVGVNPVSDGELAAHEVGHALGRLHAPCGMPTLVQQVGTDPFWPHATDPGARLREVGYDLARMEPVAGVHDFMSYCPRFWITPHNYEAILQALDGQRPRARSAAPSFLLAGAVDGADGVRLSGVFDSGATPTQDEGEGEYAVVAKNAAGVILHRHRFQPATVHPDAPDSLFAESLPALEGVALVEVEHAGRVVASRSVSAHAPQVSLLPASVGSTIRLDWTANDSDGDALRFSVLYSADGGATWTPVAADLVQTTFQIDATRLPGSERALFRVVAYDGSRSASADLPEPLFLARQPPRVELRAPRHADATLGDLLAVAEDAEDGPLAAGAVVWHVDGVPRTPETRIADLPAGRREVTARAADSDGHATTRSLVVGEPVPVPPPAVPEASTPAPVALAFLALVLLALARRRR